MEAFWAFCTATLIPALIKILIAFVIYWLGNKLIKLVLGLTEKAMVKANLDAGVQSFLKSALKIVLFVVNISEESAKAKIKFKLEDKSRAVPFEMKGGEYVADLELEPYAVKAFEF